jgi:hypothetical protein
MNYRLSFILIFLILIGTDHLWASNNKSQLCKIVDSVNSIKLCSPDKDWLYMGDKSGKENGHVWLHKKKEGEKINTFMLTVDKENDFASFDNYIGFVKSEFLRLNFEIAQEKKIDDNFSIIKLTTPDKKIEFFQAYRVLGGKTWTMSCMGPNQAIINRDCPEFIKSLVISK